MRAAPPRFFLTTSWDDGHPSDMRVADMLDRHGIAGTFYVPSFNREGRPVLSGARLRSLAQGFEIGAHTRDHVVLTECGPDEAEAQIRINRDELAETLGRRIDGFAYVRGKHDAATREIVRRLEFRFARTTVNFECRLGADPFRAPTTLQFFPHGLGAKVRNLVRRGVTRDRVGVMAATTGRGSLAATYHQAALAAMARGDFFHLWGHSWELDAFDLWGELESLLRLLSQMDARPVSNGALMRSSSCEETLQPCGQERG